MRRAKILFVDDEPCITDAVTRALRREPFDILSAHSGAEALELLQREPVDVIVADEKMPGMSGTELLERVFRDYPQMTQMMLTGHATWQAVSPATRPGQVCRFFTKPCSIEELSVAIRHALEQRSLGAASAPPPA